jgi:uncharacterized sulfatase
MYPCYLREAGYFCTNNSKEDYNLEYTGKVWDDSSPKAHWRARRPDQPFFAIFNFITTHESQIRKRPHTPVHDPASMRVPAYHPDTPEVRRDWAQYYDNIATMDGQAGEVLKQLEQDGLAEDTIVFFYGDHGSGMPRSKRWPYNSGLQVAMIAHFPEKWKHLAPPEYKAGGTSDRLVSFVDLAPTLLSLAGLKPPSHMQGYAFAGPHCAARQQVLHGFRGRMDERFDMVRTVTDGRYVYIRNYMPHKIYGQRIAYMFETPTTAVWRRMYDEGRLNDTQSRFWKPKPAEELYDLQSDRDEVQNLIGSVDHRQVTARLRKAQQEHAARVRDVGFLPEDEIHRRAGSGAPWNVGRSYDFAAVAGCAELAAGWGPEAVRPLVAKLEHTESAVRYWALTGLLIRGKGDVGRVRARLQDPAPSVAIAAAQYLASHGADEDLKAALPVLVRYGDASKHGAPVAMQALNAVESIGAKARQLAAEIRKLPQDDPNGHARFQSYVPRLLESITANL